LKEKLVETNTYRINLHLFKSCEIMHFIDFKQGVP